MSELMHTPKWHTPALCDTAVHAVLVQDLQVPLQHLFQPWLPHAVPSERAQPLISCEVAVSPKLFA